MPIDTKSEIHNHVDVSYLVGRQVNTNIPVTASTASDTHHATSDGKMMMFLKEKRN